MSGLIRRLCDIRATQPQAITRAYAARRGPRITEWPARLLVIACDHPARGVLGAGGYPEVMGDREELLSRCVEALGRPGVNGFLGTPDIVEDLLLLGALEGKIVFGSMNRGGIAGASFELDDRFTGYDAGAIAANGLDGGKMLVRIDYEDPASAQTLQAASRAVSALAAHGVFALVEPFISHRRDGVLENDLSPQAVMRAMAIAAGLGNTSAATWLKLPCVADMRRVMRATTLPSLILGGEVSPDPRAAMEQWAQALRLPNVRGLVVGRSLLFPPHGDVARAVDEAVELL